MTDKKPRIGFIGLGLMGQGFTARLAERGYRVTGYDIDRSKIEKAAGHGVRPAGSPAEVTGESDVVLLCVVSTAAVGDVVEGAGGVLEAAAPGKLLVDHSTTELEATKRLAGRLAAKGMGWVDAPVSGGPAAARAGTLAIMAGGADADIARIAPAMADLSAGFTHFGPVGAGQVAKMVNQILVLNNYAVLAEALALAEAGGIDAAKIPGALAAGHAGSNMLKAIYPRMVARDFAPQGYARQVLKDLDMLHDLAGRLGSPVPMSDRTRALFKELCERGDKELDGIAVLKLFRPE